MPIFYKFKRKSFYLGKRVDKKNRIWTDYQQITEQISWFSTNKAIYPQNLMSYPQALTKCQG
jgi:hypothetical protein